MRRERLTFMPYCGRANAGYRILYSKVTVKTVRMAPRSPFDFRNISRIHLHLLYRMASFREVLSEFGSCFQLLLLNIIRSNTGGSIANLSSNACQPKTLSRNLGFCPGGKFRFPDRDQANQCHKVLSRGTNIVPRTSLEAVEIDGSKIR